MGSLRILTPIKVLFLLVHEVNDRHRVFPSPLQLLEAVTADKGILIRSNEAEWPEDYFDPPHTQFFADLDELVDWCYLQQRPDNSLVDGPAAAEYKRRVGRLPTEFAEVVDHLWRIIEPPKKVVRHETYRARPDKP